MTLYYSFNFEICVLFTKDDEILQEKEKLRAQRTQQTEDLQFGAVFVTPKKTPHT